MPATSAACRRSRCCWSAASPGPRSPRSCWRPATATPICLARQLFADPEWANKARKGREEDIRRASPPITAGATPPPATRAVRLQPGDRPRSGPGAPAALVRVAKPKKVLVVGGGPSGLEFARIAAARGHAVVVREKERDVGGHVRLQSLLPDRDEFLTMPAGLALQARKNGATIRTESPIDERQPRRRARGGAAGPCRDRHGLADLRRRLSRGGRRRRCPGWESAYCVGWDEIVTGSALPPRRGIGAGRPVHRGGAAHRLSRVT